MELGAILFLSWWLVFIFSVLWVLYTNMKQMNRRTIAFEKMADVLDKIVKIIEKDEKE